MGGAREEGERDTGVKRRREAASLTDAESHYRGTKAASHESLGIMEELEHTCPHPRTVGHPNQYFVFLCSVCVCV